MPYLYFYIGKFIYYTGLCIVFKIPRYLCRRFQIGFLRLLHGNTNQLKLKRFMAKMDLLMPFVKVPTPTILWYNLVKNAFDKDPIVNGQSFNTDDPFSFIHTRAVFDEYYRYIFAKSREEVLALMYKDHFITNDWVRELKGTREFDVIENDYFQNCRTNHLRPLK